MVLNYIWIGFFVVAFVFGGVQLLMGDTTIFQKMVDSTFDTSKTAFETSLGLTGVLALWLGIMKIGEKAGAVNALARLLSPVFTKLFPDIPKNHPVMGSIFMNIAANMLGLDNAATPTGLKAMAGMQELNTKKDTATNPMIMFLVLNTSGLTIIPTTILAFRASYGRRAAHRCVHPHPFGDERGHVGGYHHHLYVAAYQPLPTHSAGYLERTHRLCRFGHLGLRTDGQGHDGHCDGCSR